MATTVRIRGTWKDNAGAGARRTRMGGQRYFDQYLRWRGGRLQPRLAAL
ncbi:MAG: hypothetical protein ACYC42_09155 [Lysobacter sp.]